MFRVFLTFIIIFLFTAKAIAEPQKNKIEQSVPNHPIFPLVLGAALITWGAYELSDDAEDGQRNVGVLWGGALVASAGIVLYQSSQGEGAQVTIQSTTNREPLFAFNYRF